MPESNAPMGTAERFWRFVKNWMPSILLALLLVATVGTICGRPWLFSIFLDCLLVGSLLSIIAEKKMDPISGKYRREHDLG